MLTELNQILVEYAAILNIASFLSGALLGFKFNIYAARRHERIQACTPIRKWIASELQHPGTTKKPDSFDIYEAYYRLPWLRRRRFASALQHYESEHKKPNPNKDTMQSALKICFRMLHGF